MLRKVECKFCDFLAGCCSSRPRSSRPRSSESRRSSHTQCQMKGPSPVRSACRSASVEQGDWTNGYCKFERQCNGNLARVLLDRACVLQGQFRVRRVSRQSPAPSHKTGPRTTPNWLAARALTVDSSPARASASSESSHDLAGVAAVALPFLSLTSLHSLVSSSEFTARLNYTWR